MTLHENEFYKLALDSKTPCIEWIGKRFMPSEQFRESEIKSVEFYKQHKSQHPGLGYFVDAQEIGPISPTDTQWIVDEILPQFHKLGLKKEAFVVPKTAIGKFIVKNYASTAGDVIEIKVFSTETEAKNWLKE